MKNKLIFFFVLGSLFGFSQAPQYINYQGAARRTEGTPIINKVLGIKFEIIEGNLPGSTKGVEIQTVQTNNMGLFSAKIGSVPNSTVFTNVNWQTGPHFLKVSIDTSGGTSNFVGEFTNQISSVPFALHAENVASSYTNNVLTIGKNSYTINSGVTPTINAQGNITATNTGSNFTLTVPNPTLSLSGNSLSINAGNTVVIPSNDATVIAQGILTSTNAGNNFTLNVPNAVLSNTGNILGITQGTAVSLVTLPTQINQTISAIGGIATVTNGLNSATITVPSASISANINSITLTNGTVVTTATVPLAPNAVINTQGVLSNTTAGNNFTLNVPNPVLSNTNNVLSITQGTAVSTVTLPLASVPTLSINGQNLSIVGGNTIILPSQTNQTISGTGIATAGSVTANSFTVNVPAPILNNTLNVLTITQGTAVSTVTLPSATAPVLAINGQSLSTVGGNTIILPSQTNQTISGTGIATAGSVTANSFTVNVPAPSLSNTLNVLTITQGTAVSTVTLPSASAPVLAINGQSLSTVGGNTIILPSQTNQTVSGTGIVTAGSVTANSFTVNVPDPILTNTLNVLTITQGTAVSTVTLPSASAPVLAINGQSLSTVGGNTIILPAQTNQTISGTGIATAGSVIANSFTVNVPDPILTNTLNVLTITQGTAVSTVTLPSVSAPVLAINGQSLSTVGGNTIILPAQTNQTISGTGIATAGSVTANSFTVNVPDPILTNTLNVLTITQGTAVSTVTLPSASAPVLAINGQSLSTVGGNTIILPAQTNQTISGTGIATAGSVTANSFTVNVPDPILTNTLNVLTITQGTAVSTVTLPSASAPVLAINGQSLSTIGGNTIILPAQTNQTISGTGIATAGSLTANSFSVDVPAPVLSNTLNVLTITQGTAVSTVTLPSASAPVLAINGQSLSTVGGNTIILPAQTNQTISGTGIATAGSVTANSFSVDVPAPVLSNTLNVLTITQGTAVSTVTLPSASAPVLAINGQSLSTVGGNTIILPSQTNQTVTGTGIVTAGSVTANSFTVNVPDPVLSNSLNVLTITQGTAVSTVTLPSASAPVLAINGQSLSTVGGNTIILPAQTNQTISGTGIATAGSVTANSFSVDVPAPVLSNTLNVLTITQGTAVSTVTLPSASAPVLAINGQSLSTVGGNTIILPAQTNQTISGTGIATAGSVTANSFSVDVPAPVLSNTLNVLTITQGTAVSTVTLPSASAPVLAINGQSLSTVGGNTIILPAQTNQTISGTGIATAGSVTANSFSVDVPAPVLSNTLNVLTITQGTAVSTVTLPSASAPVLAINGQSLSTIGGNTIILPAQTNQTISGTGIATAGSVTANSFSVDVPAPVLSNTLNVLTITQGTAVSTVTLPAASAPSLVINGQSLSTVGGNTILLPAQTNQTISGTGVATAGSVTANSFSVDVPAPILSNTLNVLTITQGTAVSTVTLPAASAPSLAINGQSLSTVGGNTILLPAQTNQTISGTGIATAGSVTANSFSVDVPAPILSNTLNVLTITQGTAVSTVTLPSASAPVLAINGQSLSTVGGNTIILPAQTNQTISGTGIATAGSVTANSFTVNVPDPILTNTLNVLTITQGTAVSTVTLPSASAPVLAINGQSLSTIGGNTIILPAQTNQTISGSGIATAGSITANSFSVDVPAPVLSNTLNVLTITQGTAVSTVTLPSASAPVLAINGQSLSTVGGNTIILPAQTNQTISGTGIATAGSVTANSFSVDVPAPVLSNTLNVLTITQGTAVSTVTLPAANAPVLAINGQSLSTIGGNTIILPSQTNQTISGTGVATAGSVTANSFSVDVPAPLLSNTLNVLTITQGTAVSTVTLPSVSNASIVGSGAVIVTTLTANSYSIDVAQPSLTLNNGSLSVNGINTVVITPTLALNAGTLTVGANTNTIDIAPVLTGSGAVTVSGVFPSYTIYSTPSGSVSSQTTTVTGTGLATVNSTATNVYNVNVASPVLSNTSNVLSITQGTAVSTVTLPAAASQTVSGQGVATVTNGINSATVIVPDPVLSNTLNVLSITQGTAVSTVTLPATSAPTLVISGSSLSTVGGNTVLIPAQTTQSITGTGIATAGNIAANSFSVNVPAPVLSNTSNILAISQGTAVSTVTLPSAAAQTIATQGIATVTNGVNSATLTVPNPVLSNTSNVLAITQGTAVSTVTLPSQASQTVTGQGIATVTNGINSATVIVPNPVLSNTSNVLAIIQGTAVSTVTLPSQASQTVTGQGIATVTNGINSATVIVPNPVLSNTSNVLAITQGTAVSTVTLPSQASQTVTGQGIATVTNGINSATVIVPNPVLTNTTNVLAITQGTAVSTVTLPSTPNTSLVTSGVALTTTLATNSYSIHVPNPTLTLNTNTLSINGGNTVVIPAQVNQTISTQGVATVTNGLNSATITVADPVLSNTANVLSINQGTAVSTVTLPAQTNQTISTLGVATVTNGVNSATITVANPVLTNTANVLSINQGTAVSTVTLPAQTNQTISTLGVATVTNGVNSATITVANPILSNTANVLSINQGTAVSTVTLPAQTNQTISTLGVATVTNGVNSATITVADPVLSNTANVLSINQGTAVSTVTLPAQVNQTISTLGGIATVTNGANSATITVPSSSISANGTTLTLTNGTVITTATVPAQVAQTITPQGVATVTNGLNSATINVANPVLSNTANVLSINQGTAVSTVTLPAQVNQTISTLGGIATVTNGANSATITVPSSSISASGTTLTLTNGTVITTATVPAQVAQTITPQGVATVTNGLNSATINVANPVLSNTANVLSINQGTAVSTVTLPAQVNQTISVLGGVATVTNGVNSATLTIPSSTISSSNNSVTITNGTVITTATVPLATLTANNNTLTLNDGSSTSTVAIPQTSITLTQTGTTNGIAGAGTNSFNINIPAAITPSVIGLGAAVVSPTTGNNFTVTVPQTSVSLTQTGTSNGVSTAGTNSFNINIPAAITPSVIGVGAAIVSPTTGNNFTVTVPQTSVSLTQTGTSNGVSTAGTNSFNINIPAAITPSVIGLGAAVVSPTTGNNFTVTVPQTSVSLTQTGTTNGVSTAGTNSFNINIPAAITPSVVGMGAAVVSPTTGNNFTVTVPQTSVSLTQTGTSNGVSTAGTNSFNINIPAAITPSVIGLGAAVVSPTTGNNFTVTVPQTSVSLTQTGTSNGVSTAGTNSFNINIPAAITPSVIGLGAAVVSPTTGNNFTVTVPQTSVSLTQTGTSNGVSTAGTNSFNINIPAAITPSVIGLGAAVVSPTTGNNFTVTVPQTSVSLTQTGTTNGVSTAGTNSFNINIPAAITPSVIGLGAAVVSPTTGNNFTVTVPQTSVSLTQTGTSNGVSTAGTNSFNINIPAAITPSITGAGIASVNPASGNAFTVTVNQPTFAYSQTTGSLTSGTASAFITPTLVINGGTISSGPSSNSIALNTGTNAMWFTTGNAATSATANFIGTTDNVPLSFRVNNQKAGSISPSGPTFIGYQAGNTNSATSLYNTGIGNLALSVNTSGDWNTGIGSNALEQNTIGNSNTAVGFRALRYSTTGNSNSAFGSDALTSNTIGAGNAAFGEGALYLNTSGNQNSAFGQTALTNNTSGIRNSVIGWQSLINNTTGNFNVSIGAQAGNSNLTGGSNVFIGYQSGYYETGSNKLYISNSSTSLTPLIYGDFANNRLSIGTSTVSTEALNIAGNMRLSGAIMPNNIAGTAGQYLVSAGTNSAPVWTSIGTGSNTLWSTIGNAATSSTANFIGTTDNVPLSFRVNNLKSGTIDQTGPTFFGYQAGNANTNNLSTGFGYQTLQSNTGSDNTAVGYQAMAANTSGGFNTAFGSIALLANTTGARNTALGFEVLASNTTGNHNTGAGYAALYANTTGSFNTSYGYASMNFNTTGNFNTANGYNSLYANTTGQENTAAGYNALLSNTTGSFNTANGASALRLNTTGIRNTATGMNTLFNNTTGSNNTASGFNALAANTTGSFNTANGYDALFSNKTGTENVADGYRALYNNITAARNTAIGTYALGAQSFSNAGTVWNSENVALGYEALLSNQPTSTTNGNQNTALGNYVLRANTTGNFNAAGGHGALYSNTTGQANTAFGYNSLVVNAASSFNTSVGYYGLSTNTSGQNNTSLGYQSGDGNTTGSNNTFIGSNADASSGILTNVTALGANATATASNRVKLGNSADVEFDKALMPGGSAGTSGQYLVSAGSGSAPVWTSINSGTAAVWSTLGNSATNPSVNFIGTTDVSTLNFRVANQKAGMIEATLANSFYGYQSGSAITTGSANSAYGYQSLFSNSTGSFNTANGSRALYSNTSGQYNVALGFNSLENNTTGGQNIALGAGALKLNTTGGRNVAIGFNALSANTTGTDNIAIGAGALQVSNGDNNTAIGTLVLFNNTSGSYNTGNGNSSLRSNTTGSFNTGFGSEALRFNTTGSENTGTGNTALYSNTTGSFNTANGSQALYSNSTGSLNASFGYSALYDNTTGYANTGVGAQALSNNTSGFFNTAIGHSALITNTTGAFNTGLGVNGLYSNTTGSLNTATGYQSLFSNTIGSENSANGANSLYSNTTGSFNTANGSQALYSNTTGQENTSTGYNSLLANTTGSFNTAYGAQALDANTTGSYNNAFGRNALNANTTGSNNVALGNWALNSNTTGSRNVAIGSFAGDAVTTATGNVFLGYAAGTFETTSDNLWIANSTTSTTPLIHGDFVNNYLAIGTNSANAPLQFNNTITAATRRIVLWEGGNNDHQVYGFGLSSNTLRYQVDASVGNHVFYSGINSTSSQELMRIQGNRRIGINNATPTATLDIAGTFKLKDGTEAAGRYLTTDASGNASWTAVNSGTAALWSTQGNSGTSGTTNFIGTTDTQTLNFRVANQKSGMIDATLQNAFFGYQSGNAITTGSSNAAFGHRALTANTSGFGNSAFGYQSMVGNTTGTANTAMGLQALGNNSSGILNSGIGYAALQNNTSGDYNTAAGGWALTNNTIGEENTATGYNSLFANTTGSFNTANGSRALDANTSGSYNSAFGAEALSANTTGSATSAFGNEALKNNTSGDQNSAFGYQTLFSNTTGEQNTAAGFRALLSNSTGSNNSAYGAQTLRNNTTGYNNSALGDQSLMNNTIGSFNDAFGRNSLQANTTGSSNVAFGNSALSNNVSGTQNVAIGTSAGNGVITGSANVFIGHGAGSSYTGSDRLFIANSTGTTTPLISGDFANNYVGIGIGAPTASLDFGSIAGGNNKMISLWGSSSGNDNQYYGFGISSSTLRYHVQGTNQQHVFYAGTSSTTANELMRINGNGRVGIGTSNVASALLTLSVQATNTIDPVGLFITNNYTGTATKYGIDVNIDGYGSGTKYGINSSVIGLAGDNSLNVGYYSNMQPYGTLANNIGFYNVTTGVGTGARYGLYSTIASSVGNTNAIHGIYSGIDKPSGSSGLSYGIYNQVTNNSSSNSFNVFGLNSGTATTKYGVYMSGETDNYFSGFVGIGTVSPTSKLHVIGDVKIPAANEYQYATAKTMYSMVGAVSFDTPNGLTTNGGVSGPARHISGGSSLNAGYLLSNVMLPQSATITTIEAYVTDGDATYEVDLDLIRHTPSSGAVSIIAGTSSSSGAPGALTLSATGLSIVVDNSIYSYVLRFNTRESNSSLQIKGVRITYLVDHTD